MTTTQGPSNTNNGNVGNKDNINNTENIGNNGSNSNNNIQNHIPSETQQNNQYSSSQSPTSPQQQQQKQQQQQQQQKQQQQSPQPKSKNPLKILAIGSAYEDTILYVDKFPPEDGKQRAQRVEKRRGGNAGNTLTVLSQFPLVNASFMASMASKEASTFIIQDFNAHNIKTSTCIFRPSATHAPVAYIIQAESTSSRTIVNYNSIDELTFDEFKKKFDTVCNEEIPFNLIHFEGRNAAEETKMIDYIGTMAWRKNSIISVELEKPYRKGLETLMQRADILFFSKVFAEGKGYNNASDFLQVMSPFCKDTAYLFCTWGNSGAMCFHNPTQKLYSSSALPIPSVVDSVGAGDTFIAGAIYGLSQEMSPEGCLKFACELAGRKCAQIGFDGVVEKLNKPF